MYSFSRLGKLGRLGNQLFQVAATLATAAEYGKPAKFPPWRYAQYFAGDFDQSLRDADISYTYFEPNFEFTSIPELSEADLFGFFQCEKYFSNHEQLIRNQFKFVEGLLPENWRSVTPDCAIHVRRGDYLNEAHRFVPLKMDYYERAIAIAKERGCETFVLCSDDPHWCRENFPSFVQVVDDLNDIQSLCLMSRCKNHIIANSTLSWWSSWLGSNSDKFILSPQIWYSFTLSFRKNYSFQYCPNWELIPNAVSLPDQIFSLARTKEPELFYLPYVSRHKWLLAEERAHARKFAK
ncbi:MAG TPA: alpha-1,2-fucosyltransferase [Drouetiella sp.]